MESPETYALCMCCVAGSMVAIKSIQIVLNDLVSRQLQKQEKTT